MGCRAESRKVDKEGEVEINKMRRKKKKKSVKKLNPRETSLVSKDTHNHTATRS